MAVATVPAVSTDAAPTSSGWGASRGSKALAASWCAQIGNSMAPQHHAVELVRIVLDAGELHGNLTSCHCPCLVEVPVLTVHHGEAGLQSGQLHVVDEHLCQYRLDLLGAALGPAKEHEQHSRHDGGIGLLGLETEGESVVGLGLGCLQVAVQPAPQDAGPHGDPAERGLADLLGQGHGGLGAPVDLPSVAGIEVGEHGEHGGEEPGNRVMQLFCKRARVPHDLQPLLQHLGPQDRVEAQVQDLDQHLRIADSPRDLDRFLAQDQTALEITGGRELLSEQGQESGPGGARSSPSASRARSSCPIRS